MSRVHITKDGTAIKLCDMSDSHLAAAIRMMERNAAKGIVVYRGGGTCPEEYWYDEKHLQGEEALEYLGYSDYARERDRRISNGKGRCK